jgi:hypothetical protein
MFIELSLYTIYIPIVTNNIVFNLTRPRLEPAIYRTQDENGNNYSTDAVQNHETASVL